MDCSMPGSLSFIISQSLLKLMSIELVMPSNHLILCHPLLLLPPVFPSIRVFSDESALRVRWPGASASVLPMNIRVDCLYDWLVWSPCCPRHSQESSPNTTVQMHPTTCSGGTRSPTSSNTKITIASHSLLVLLSSFLVISCFLAPFLSILPTFAFHLQQHLRLNRLL